MNQWARDEDLAFYREEVDRIGAAFEPALDRIILLDISTLHAQAYMRRYDVTSDQIASVASKSHRHGVCNR